MPGTDDLAIGCFDIEGPNLILCGNNLNKEDSGAMSHTQKPELFGMINILPP